MTSSQHVYEVRPRKDHRGVDLISDALGFGRLWYDGPNAVANAIGYAMHHSRSADAVIRVYDDAARPLPRDSSHGPSKLHPVGKVGPDAALTKTLLLR
jgi:hypothetical protein